MKLTLRPASLIKTTNSAVLLFIHGFYFSSLFSRFPAPALPAVSQWEDMFSTAFSMAIMGFVVNLAAGRKLAAKHGYDVDPNQVEELHIFCSLIPH